MAATPRKSRAKSAPAHAVEVEIVAPTPVPVTFADNDTERRITQRPMPAKTTFQEDLTVAGQRRVNLIWEYTQATIALMVILANVIVGAARGLGYGGPSEYPIILSSSLFLIVGFYFSRTNHQAIGGIGIKENEVTKYRGR